MLDPRHDRQTDNRALLVYDWWNFIGMQHVFGTASNGQDMDLVTFDRKDCPVTGARTETEGQITNLVRKFVILVRQRVTLRKRLQTFERRKRKDKSKGSGLFVEGK